MSPVRTSLPLVFVLAAAPALAARNPAAPDSLEAGRRVTVVFDNGGRMEGLFKGSDERTVSIEREGRVIAIFLDSIAAIEPSRINRPEVHKPRLKLLTYLSDRSYRVPDEVCGFAGGYAYGPFRAPRGFQVRPVRTIVNLHHHRHFHAGPALSGPAPAPAAPRRRRLNKPWVRHR